MVNYANAGECCGCSACVNICPVGSIAMIQDGEGFWVPKVDKKKCIKCNLCVKTCTQMHKITKERYFKEAYGAINNDDLMRGKSTSGGIFPAIAKYFIKNKGYVYGAALDNGAVKHIEVSDETDLEKLQGSKYVQSDMNNVYSMVKKRLMEGASVMFSGTPCQVSGLYSFLHNTGIQYSDDKLFTVDLICHGVPSPLLFRTYWDYLCEQEKSSISSFRFRDKNCGYSKPMTKVSFSSGKEIHFLFTGKKDKYSRYIKAFNSNVSLNQSCRNCIFCSIYRKSDLTIGDLYLGGHVDLFNDDKGASLILANSHKGEGIINSINISTKKINISKAIMHNQSAFSGAFVNKRKRKKYYDCWRDRGIEYVIEQDKYNSDVVFKYLGKSINMLKYFVVCLKLTWLNNR